MDFDENFIGLRDFGCRQRDNVKSLWSGAFMNCQCEHCLWNLKSHNQSKSKLIIVNQDRYPSELQLYIGDRPLVESCGTRFGVPSR
jgi:hypothetical protein